MNSSILPIDGCLTGITTPGQSGPTKNGNEEVLHVPQIPGQSFHHQMEFSIIARTNGFSSRIWTRVAESISYIGNYFSK